MAAPPQAGPAAPPEPRPRLSRLPVGRAQEKRAPSEGPPAAPPQQKRSRTGLGPGAAKAAPKAPLRAPLRTLGAAAGKNDGPRKAASVAAAPRAGSVTSTSSKGASKRPPWDLRGQLGDLREALGQAQEQLQGLQGEKQELESSNRALREQLERLQSELGQRDSRESSLCARLRSLELEVSQYREELEQSQHRVEALVAKERRLQAQEQQRRQERDEALGRAQELSEQLENTGAQLQQTQQQLQEQLEQVAALRELEASKQALLAEREDCIHLLEMERRRLHNDIQELRGNIRVFCRVRPLLPEELQRQRGLPHLHFPEGDARSLLLTRPDDSQVGRERRAELRYDFSFDRVFPPAASQQDIFKEIQLLVQSALDGYPVCIFAYGQTGSGKTFTMEGPAPPGPPESRGMIPRAVRHLFRGAQELAGKGWQLPGDLQRGAARPAAGQGRAGLRAGDPQAGTRQRPAARAQPHLGARGERGAGSGAAGARGLAALGGAHGAERALVALALGVPAAHPGPPRRPRPALRLLADPGGPGWFRASGEVGLGGEPAQGDAEHQLQPERPGDGHQRPLQQGVAHPVPEQQTDLPAAELPGGARQSADDRDHLPPGGELCGVAELAALRQQGERVHDRHGPGQPEVTQPLFPTFKSINQ
ncbi:kinesin-like protein KIFC1 isoform X1 [Ammospiza caudacuta]|uniref:kinesin-like protein KIFC1 isoform X1 n=1 Tax=Ammospiza caudacuta TaxID=2857398 RepID=UPI00273A0774|nr:kinesin-like protein KIFC1 isoform X1 [Ammospiza caudacuta]